MLQSLFGLFVLIGLGWVFSEQRAKIALRPILAGLALQLGLAALFLHVPPLQRGLAGLNAAVVALADATKAGTAFVFGFLGGGPLPFDEKFPGASFNLAFQALPQVIVVSALASLLFYWGVLPLVVRGLSWVLRKTLGIGGAVGISAAATIFIGMVEAPLLARPYLKDMSRSELFVVMSTGMATIAGTVMVLYATILARAVPNAAGNILLASLINAPAAIVIARMMIPDTAPPTGGALVVPEPASSSIDAIAKGTLSGVQLLINIVAFLLVLVALVHLVNQMLGLLPDAGGGPLTLQRLLGYVMAPVCWLMGVPWSEAPAAGALMGTKTVLNEFIAYIDLANLPPGTLSERSRVIMTYALCGFANFGSLGILIGGLGTMAPERRADIVELGPKAILSGTLATCMSGAVVGLLS
ncbi:MAG TPA: nucleoside transporter C-terminal domain-containing protein [Candidatus Sulfotelmatobacter sp.]|nr:nucleoside transporter C-terminal domain-containing protein [Candidatus Sulfotelmatobacter sp.]